MTYRDDPLAKRNSDVKAKRRSRGTNRLIDICPACGRGIARLARGGFAPHKNTFGKWCET